MVSAVVLSVYRWRVVLFIVAIIALIAGPFIGGFLPLGTPQTVVKAVIFLGLGLMVLALLLTAIGRRLSPSKSVTVLDSPVGGRWTALNSPQSRVPSHGIHVYGQTYAIDFVFDPESPARPEFGGDAMRPVTDYPGFGAPVYAMADGTVVKTSMGQRDHRARSSIAGFLYMFLEGMIRELGGPKRIVGNHVIVDHGDGNFSLLAHLQQGSVMVKPGERVTSGQEVGKCGNSGNSSEPHVHAQIMDRISLLTAQGRPFVVRDCEVNDERGDQLPGNEESMTVTYRP